jgi:drug/metabolite transporter (DMT)-like permease
MPSALRHIGLPYPKFKGLLAGEQKMDLQRIIGILLLVAGVLGLVYGGFTYTKDTHKADLGPIHLSVAEKEHVSVPLWAGVGAIVIGGILLVVRRKT